MATAIHPSSRPESGQLERFLDKISPEPMSGCWLWAGCISTGSSPTGYGSVRWNKKTEKAHRVSYELFSGPIPAGLEIDHKCRNTYCVNPNHLEPVTGYENWYRGFSPTKVNYLKTHCSKGHPLSGDNLRIEMGKGRRCVICRRAKGSAYYYRNRREVIDKQIARRKARQQNPRT